MNLKTTIVSIAGASILGLLAGRLVAEEKPPVVSLSKPNIIFFLADDQRNDVLG